MSITLIDANYDCNCTRCQSVGTGVFKHYYMVGSCKNCDSYNMVLAFRFGHARKAATCPLCGVSMLVAFRSATQEEITKAGWSSKDE